MYPGGGGYHHQPPPGGMPMAGYYSVPPQGQPMYGFYAGPSPPYSAGYAAGMPMQMAYPGVAMMPMPVASPPMPGYSYGTMPGFRPPAPPPHQPPAPQAPPPPAPTRVLYGLPSSAKPAMTYHEGEDETAPETTTTWEAPPYSTSGHVYTQQGGAEGAGAQEESSWEVHDEEGAGEGGEEGDYEGGGEEGEEGGYEEESSQQYTTYSNGSTGHAPPAPLTRKVLEIKHPGATAGQAQKGQLTTSKSFSKLSADVPSFVPGQQQSNQTSESGGLKRLSVDVPAFVPGQTSRQPSDSGAGSTSGGGNKQLSVAAPAFTIKPGTPAGAAAGGAPGAPPMPAAAQPPPQSVPPASTTSTVRSTAPAFVPGAAQSTAPTPPPQQEAASSMKPTASAFAPSAQTPRVSGETGAGAVAANAPASVPGSNPSVPASSISTSSSLGLHVTYSAPAPLEDAHLPSSAAAGTGEAAGGHQQQGSQEERQPSSQAWSAEPWAAEGGCATAGEGTPAVASSAWAAPGNQDKVAPGASTTAAAPVGQGSSGGRSASPDAPATPAAEARADAPSPSPSPDTGSITSTGMTAGGGAPKGLSPDAGSISTSAPHTTTQQQKLAGSRSGAGTSAAGGSTPKAEPASMGVPASQQGQGKEGAGKQGVVDVKAAAVSVSATQKAAATTAQDQQPSATGSSGAQGQGGAAAEEQKPVSGRVSQTSSSGGGGSQLGSPTHAERPRNIKPVLCRYFTAFKGFCPNGMRCTFAHGGQELSALKAASRAATPDAGGLPSSKSPVRSKSMTPPPQGAPPAASSAAAPVTVPKDPAAGPASSAGAVARKSTAGDGAAAAAAVPPVARRSSAGEGALKVATAGSAEDLAKATSAVSAALGGVLSNGGSSTAGASSTVLTAQQRSSRGGAVGAPQASAQPAAANGAQKATPPVKAPVTTRQSASGAAASAPSPAVQSSSVTQTTAKAAAPPAPAAASAPSVGQTTTKAAPAAAISNTPGRTVVVPRSPAVAAAGRTVLVNTSKAPAPAAAAPAAGPPTAGSTTSQASSKAAPQAAPAPAASIASAGATKAGAPPASASNSDKAASNQNTAAVSDQKAAPGAPAGASNASAASSSTLPSSSSAAVPSSTDTGAQVLPVKAGPAVLHSTPPTTTPGAASAALALPPGSPAALGPLENVMRRHPGGLPPLLALQYACPLARELCIHHAAHPGQPPLVLTPATVLVHPTHPLAGINISGCQVPLPPASPRPGLDATQQQAELDRLAFAAAELEHRRTELSPIYMAPELQPEESEGGEAGGAPPSAVPGPATDIWSLGALMVHMLIPNGSSSSSDGSGGAPRVAGPLAGKMTEEEFAKAMRTKGEEIVASLTTHIPPRLAAILRRCLAADPRARPSAEDVLKELVDCAEPAGPDGGLGGLLRWRMRQLEEALGYLQAMVSQAVNQAQSHARTASLLHASLLEHNAALTAAREAESAALTLAQTQAEAAAKAQEEMEAMRQEMAGKEQERVAQEEELRRQVDQLKAELAARPSSAIVASRGGETTAEGAGCPLGCQSLHTAARLGCTSCLATYASLLGGNRNAASTSTALPQTLTPEQASAPDARGWSPLHYAVLGSWDHPGHRPGGGVARLIAAAGASSVGGSGAEGSGGVAHNSSSSRVQDPLACITQLLEWGADPWAPGPGEVSPVELAVRGRRLRALQLLAETPGVLDRLSTSVNPVARQRLMRAVLVACLPPSTSAAGAYDARTAAARAAKSEAASVAARSAASQASEAAHAGPAPGSHPGTGQALTDEADRAAAEAAEVEAAGSDVTAALSGGIILLAKALLDLGPAPGGVDAQAEGRLLWPALCEAAVLCPPALAVAPQALLFMLHAFAGAPAPSLTLFLAPTPEAIGFCISLGANPNEVLDASPPYRFAPCSTPLLWAAWRMAGPGVVGALISAGADVRAVTSASQLDDNTAAAAEQGQQQGGVAQGQVNKQQRSHKAGAGGAAAGVSQQEEEEEQGEVMPLSLLLPPGVATGDSPLTRGMPHVSLRRGHESSSGALRAGQTALHLAVSQGLQAEVVQVLLDAGADVCAADEEGWTPLHCAAAARWLPGWKETWTGSGSGTASASTTGSSTHASTSGQQQQQQHRVQRRGDGEGPSGSSAAHQGTDESDHESDAASDITLCPHKLLRLEGRRLEVIKLLVTAARRAGAMSAATALNAEGASPLSLYTLEATARVTRLKESLGLLSSTHHEAGHHQPPSRTPEVQVGTLDLMAVNSLDALLLETSSYLGLVAKIDLAASSSIPESSGFGELGTSGTLSGDDVAVPL